MAMALGVEHADEVADRLTELVELKPPTTLREKFSTLGRLVEFSKYPAKIVRSAPCQEVVEMNPDLNTLPIIKCWPEDGGKFITLPLVVTRGVKKGDRNLGVYRMQVYDERTTAMHCHLHHDGARHIREHEAAGNGKMDVAVAIGADPITVYSGTSPLPPGMDELLFAGFLRRQGVPLVKCKTVDLEVPAEAEFVLEGYINPSEKRREGPFGDHTGYYSMADDYPVFHLNCITHRKQPVYLTTIVGRPPMEDYFMGNATERIFLPLLRLTLPEIVDMHLPAFGIFHNFAIVSIDKSYPYQARKVMHGLWGMGQMSITKMIIVVDRDVNVHDVDEVLWRVGNNIDPKRDCEFSEGPMDVLNHASSHYCAGSKMGIDATTKMPEEGFPREWPPDIVMSPEIKSLVDERWKSYGISG